MAVEIIWDSEQRVAAMYCTTSDSAFGPIFTGPAANVDLGAFLDWLPVYGAVVISPTIGSGKDPRDYSADELARLVRLWCDKQEEDGDA